MRIMLEYLRFYTALTEKPSEIELSDISKNVGRNWRSLLTYLGIPLYKIDSLLLDYSGKTTEAFFAGLVFWREGNKPCKEASWSVLLEALEKGAERVDYAETLRREIVGNPTRYRSVYSESSNQGKTDIPIVDFCTPYGCHCMMTCTVNFSVRCTCMTLCPT